jgi:hypothetical protein
MRDWLLLTLLLGLWLVLGALLGRHVLTRFPAAVPFAVNPRLTAFVIVATPLLLGLLDVLLYALGGNESTISYVMLSASACRPTVALATCYTFGVLLSHLFLPVNEDGPPRYEVLARMMFVLGPTFYGLIIIGAGNGTLAAHDRAIAAGGQAAFAGKLLAAVSVGGLMGRLLPQHLPPTVP